jgi:hypothetical protein
MTLSETSQIPRFGTIRQSGAWRSLVSAPVWGTGGPEFESRRPDELGEAAPMSEEAPSGASSASGVSAAYFRFSVTVYSMMLPGFVTVTFASWCTITSNVPLPS